MGRPRRPAQADQRSFWQTQRNNPSCGARRRATSRASEANEVVNRYNSLSAGSRQDVLNFLRSL
jgi:hypothetical protein